MSAPVVNSREWWDWYFSENWDANDGGGQTRHFMERLVANLPAAERDYLRHEARRILDWGCAFGEGVSTLASAFPRCQVVGLDFSHKALNEARRRFPRSEFVHMEKGEIPEQFDVVVTSNCLEHFESPLEVAESMLSACEQLLVILVPYEEDPLSEFHLSRFTEGSFPRQLRDFHRIHCDTIEVDQKYWAGKQLLVLYSSSSYMMRRLEDRAHTTEQQKWDSYYATESPAEEDGNIKVFNQEFAERIEELLPNGARILEAGCGDGWQSLALARTGKHDVTLMDFSQGALDHAQQRFEREGLAGSFVLGDAQQKGEPEFDLVFNAGVLEHYDPAQQASFLRGMASRSRQYVMALVPNRLCYWYWLWRIRAVGEENWPFGKEVPLVDLTAAFESAGLKFLGQTFMGDTWSETFINGISGIAEDLRRELRLIHRSAVIPDAEKSYLVAMLGSVRDDAVSVPSAWREPPFKEQFREAELYSAMGEALGQIIKKEKQLERKERELSWKEQELQNANAVLNSPWLSQVQVLRRIVHYLAPPGSRRGRLVRDAAGLIRKKQ